MKFYLIYKITNKLNGKYYIGKHITKNINDNYMGSGKCIKSAIKKYGIDNFEKQIIKVYDNEHDMNIAESLLIDLNDQSIYNLQLGGKGGWSYINIHNLSNTEESKEKKSNTMKKYWTEERKNQKSIDMKKYNKINGTERYSSALKRRFEDQEFKNNFDQKMSIINNNPEKIEKAKDTIKKRWKEDCEFREKMKNRKPRGSDGSSLKEKWKDPIWREKMLNARKKNKS